jgi:hypothetical protein
LGRETLFSNPPLSSLKINELSRGEKKGSKAIFVNMACYSDVFARQA